jgi:hypothetical protein
VGNTFFLLLSELSNAQFFHISITNLNGPLKTLSGQWASPSLCRTFFGSVAACITHELHLHLQIRGWDSLGGTIIGESSAEFSAESVDLFAFRRTSGMNRNDL